MGEFYFGVLNAKSTDERVKLLEIMRFVRDQRPGGYKQI